MSISRLSALMTAANDIEAFNQVDRPYLIASPLEGSIHVAQVDSEQFPANDQVANLNCLLDKTIAELASTSLKTRPISDYKTFEKVIALCGKLLKKIPAAEATSEQLKELKFKLLSAKCGGLVPWTVFRDNADFRKFIEVNFLQNMLTASHMQLIMDENGQPCIPIGNVSKEDGRVEVVADQPATLNIAWNRLEKTETPTGYNFSVDGVTLFKTSADYELDYYAYSFNHLGVIPYYVKDAQVLNFDQRDPREWQNKYVLELWTAMVDKSGFQIQPCVGDHSYLILRDGQNGKIYSVGQFGVKRDYRWYDYLTPLSRKSSGLESPDRYVYMPKGTYNLQMVETELDKEQFEGILARCEANKGDKDYSFSLLKKNCTSWAVQLVNEELGIKLDPSLQSLSFVIRQILPTSWQKLFYAFLDRTFGQLPSWLQHACYFFPVVYALYLPLALLAKSISTGNKGGISDLPWLDIIFRPWNTFVDHPASLRQNLWAQDGNGDVRLGEKLYPDSQATGTLTNHKIKQ